MYKLKKSIVLQVGWFPFVCSICILCDDKISSCICQNHLSPSHAVHSSHPSCAHVSYGGLHISRWLSMYGLHSSLSLCCVLLLHSFQPNLHHINGGTLIYTLSYPPPAHLTHGLSHTCSHSSYVNRFSIKSSRRTLNFLLLCKSWPYDDTRCLAQWKLASLLSSIAVHSHCNWKACVDLKSPLYVAFVDLLSVPRQFSVLTVSIQRASASGSSIRVVALNWWSSTL